MFYSVSKKTQKAADTFNDAIELGEKIRETIVLVYGEQNADRIFENKWSCFTELTDMCKDLIMESVNSNLMEGGGEL